MNWFLVRLIFMISCKNKSRSSQFDEQLRLITARNQVDALLKARELGKEGESSFLNYRDNEVCWKFIDVADVLSIGEIKDGMELYSHTHVTEETDTYIKFVQKRADLILEQQLQIAIG